MTEPTQGAPFPYVAALGCPNCGQTFPADSIHDCPESIHNRLKRLEGQAEKTEMERETLARWPTWRCVLHELFWGRNPDRLFANLRHEESLIIEVPLRVRFVQLLKSLIPFALSVIISIAAFKAVSRRVDQK